MGSAQALETELNISKELIENEIGLPVLSFSYPYAFPSSTDRSFLKLLRELMVEIGYGIGVTTMIGSYTLGSDLLALRRIPVNTHDDALSLEAKMEGGYDPIYYFQSIYERHAMRTGRSVG